VKLVNMISFIYLNHRHHGLLVFDAVMVLVRLRRWSIVGEEEVG